jgi:hypothetical protein
VKLINQAFVFFSLVSLGLSSLEAKSLEFFLDHTPQEIFNLQSIPNQMQEHPFNETSIPPLYCQQLTIENLGDQPIKNCFPYVNQAPSTSMEDLASKLADEEYPLLALYHLWNRSLVRDEEVDSINCHPLDLLNFKGVCSSETFNLQFIKLCNALGIETRLANVHGKSLYDFCLDDEWNFLDLTNHQLYLGLNNEKLVSSEEVMDDPFLALRTKHQRHARQVDFQEAWKQLARFEILEPASAMPVMISSAELRNRPQGLDLFPGEALVFGTPALNPELAKYERSIEHTLNLEARQVPLFWHYSSPFPIQKLVNYSSVSIRLIDQKVDLKPGDSVNFKDQGVFLVNLEFASQPKGKLIVSGICAKTLFPDLANGRNQISIGAKDNPSIIRFSYDVNESIENSAIPILRILNDHDTFDYCSPYFLLESPSQELEMIWWQISPDLNFQLIPSNFDQVEPFTSSVTLPLISETFLNPGTPYYFRVRGYNKGKWSEWSIPYAFVVNKPAAIEEVELEQIEENLYELDWERCAEEADESIEYLVFGSNALDFIPSIYCEKQVNAIVNGEVTEEETNDNLIAITTEPKIKVQGGLAYYRIIARQRGQLSVPSAIIHVYDQDLIQPRNVLQVVEDDQHQILVKRSLFPPAYPWSETSLPHVDAIIPKQNNLIKVQALLRSAAKIGKNHQAYESPEVSPDIWDEVRPYLLPSNHPAWAKLNRVFCKSRATQNSETFKKAGFKRWRPGRWSRVSASSHPEFQEYFIKAYCDSELGIIYDWKKWIHRIKGAETIRECIKKHDLQSTFKVPHKWIYPLPKNPSPPNSSKYIRKNFILVCENMRIQDHDKNEKMYKKKMTRKLMDGLYTILQVCGLYDSVYCFNIPFCKDGRIAIIDTEYHHKWPVPFSKLNKSFSKDLRPYWEQITYKGGHIPDGKSQPNPPRMDRRDVQKKDVQK